MKAERARWRRLARPLVAAAAIVAGTAAAAAPLERAALERFVDATMAEHFERYRLAGAAVAVVHDGELVLSKGYGYADVATARPVDPAATVFSTASVAKLFTWTAVMQLVERGAIDLDDPVHGLLGAVRLPHTSGEPIRVRHLLDHTAGFEDTPVVGLVARDAGDVPDLATALVRWMPDRVRPPGELGSYNNYGAALAGHLVAEVSGTSWEAYIETEILEPLGMASTSPRQPLPADLVPYLATSYVDGPAGLVETPFEYTTIVPSGGMVATVDDMARFLIAHLRHGLHGDARILEAATAARMHERSFSHHPSLPGVAHGFWEGVAHGRRYLHHGGDTSSYTKLVMVPGHDLGFYVAYNSPDGSVAREAFTAAFFDHVFGGAAADTDAVPALADTAAVPPGTAGVPTPGAAAATPESLAGRYGDTRVSTSTIAKLMGLTGTITIAHEDGALVTDLPGRVPTGAPTRWVEVGPALFVERGGTEHLAFRVDERGRGTHAFFGAYPELSFEATAWYDRLELHGGLFGVWLVALVTASVPWRRLARSRRAAGSGEADGRSAPGWSRLGRGLPLLASALYLAFLVSLVMALADVTELELGIGPTLAAGLSLTVVAAALTAASAVRAAFAWSRGSWSPLERVRFTVLTLACVSLTWQLHHWNLLGIRL